MNLLVNRTHTPLPSTETNLYNSACDKTDLCLEMRQQSESISGCSQIHLHLRSTFSLLLTVSSMSITTSITEILSEAISQSFHDTWSIVSSTVVLIWDIIITFDQEIELIWRTPKCVVNYLFFIIRYGVLIQGIMSLTLNLGEYKTNHNICRVFTWSYVLSGVITLCSVDLLLVYRAVAFYANDRRILIGLVICWLTNSVVLIVIGTLLGIGFPIFHNNTLFAFGARIGCLETVLPRLLHYVWISELTFQSIVFLLILIRFIRQSVISWNGRKGINTVYFVFIRDGVWAYFLLFGLFVTSVTVDMFADISVLVWAVNFTAITATRLILNLRGLNPSHANSTMECYSVSLPKWVGGSVRVDTMIDTTGTGSDITLSQGDDVVELQTMGVE